MQDRQQTVESSQELLEVKNAYLEDVHTRLLTGEPRYSHYKKSQYNGSAQINQLTPP